MFVSYVFFQVFISFLSRDKPVLAELLDQKSESQIVEYMNNDKWDNTFTLEQLPYLVHYSIEKDYSELLKKLIVKYYQGDTNVIYFQEMGETPLYSTIRSNSYNCCKMLLEGGANPNFKPYPCGNELSAFNTSAFELACFSGPPELPLLMLDFGADPNSEYCTVGMAYFSTPVIYLALKNPKLVAKLIEKGADANHRLVNSYGVFTPRMVAQYSGFRDSYQLLINSGGCHDKQLAIKFNFLSCIIRDDPKLLMEILNKNPNILARTLDGKTPIILAVEADNLDILKALVEHGFDLNMTDQRGRSPGFCAINKGNIELIKYLFNQKSLCKDYSLLGRNYTELARKYGSSERTVQLINELMGE